MPEVDDGVLDDPAALEQRDPGGMLRAVASSGAQVREAMLYASPEVLAGVAAEGRPRTVLITGMGGSGIVAEIAAAVVGRSCPVAVLTHRGYRLPGWVGAMDLVIAVSSSGQTEETLSVLDEALRRGARVVTVGADGSPLAARAEQGRAVHLRAESHGRMPRANLWALTVPVLLVLDALDLLDAPRELLERVANRLDVISETCGPSAESFDNPAKRLALSLAGSLPYVWGSSDVAAAAASRFAAQLAENAKYPAVAGSLPEVHHNAVVALAGRFGAHARGSEDSSEDIFWDPVEDGGEAPVRLRVLLLHDTDELPPVARRREATWRVAERYGVTVDEVVAEGDHPVERLATLVAPLDFASVYLALLQGIDPSPVEPILLLKAAAAAPIEEDPR